MVKSRQRIRKLWKFLQIFTKHFVEHWHEYRIMQIRELRICGMDSKDIQWITKNQMLPFPNCLSSLFLNALTEQADRGYLLWRLFHKSTTLWAKKNSRTHIHRRTGRVSLGGGGGWGGRTWSLVARIFSPLHAQKSTVFCQNSTCFWPEMAIWPIRGGGGGGSPPPSP